VLALVDQTRQRSGWPVRRTLALLDVSAASYYRWARRQSQPRPAALTPRALLALRPEERQAIVDYALAHPEVRHRELAWRMLDDDVCAVSPSSVYRVLAERELVQRWQPRRRSATGERTAPGRRDELWQTDIRYTKVGGRNYYLLSFIDVYARFVVHHALLRSMDGRSVAIEAAAALETLPAEVRPLIQSDHGSGFIAREFAETLAAAGVGHTLIRPHTPTDNGVIERYHRTIGERIDAHELTDYGAARRVVTGIIEDYNHRRLHAALCYLRPVDFYRGDPEALLAERRRKLQQARHLRKQANIRLRQPTLPLTG